MAGQVTDLSVLIEHSALGGGVIHQRSITWWSAGIIAAFHLFSHYRAQILFTPPDEGKWNIKLVILFC